ncbi:hypothetical protein [Spongiactinospora sp. TRM90649]|uniref:hypothetical protein n=1 Tax=Spongiactinospora sp. TRM90649 TaxID=3031114 RepID=UPI0023F7E44B|nr:hypothetical protein [Spongiactinospora sp. TRM90649]MDF5755634.1 hypothetical protein [Spongiactinospora sp. TRM90649]
MAAPRTMASPAPSAEAADWARRIAAYLLASIVHLSTLAFLATGVWTIVRAPQYLFSWLFGGLLTAIGVTLRPRTARAARDAEPLDPAATPRLHAAASRVAARMGVPEPEMIMIRDLAVGASYERIGLRRRRVLTIGLPLWLAFDPGHRVALLAKAFSRGNETDDLVLGGALATLGEWRGALLASAPLTSREEANRQMQMTLGAFAPDTSYEVAGFFGRVLGRVLGGPVLLIEHVLRRMVRGGERRATEEAARRAALAATPAALAGVEQAMAAPGRLITPLHSAALRGEKAPVVRQVALERAADSPGTAADDLLTEGESAAVDDELLPHYTRALPGLGLLG